MLDPISPTLLQSYDPHLAPPLAVLESVAAAVAVGEISEVGAPSARPGAETSFDLPSALTRKRTLATQQQQARCSWRPFLVLNEPPAPRALPTPGRAALPSGQGRLIVGKQSQPQLNTPERPDSHVVISTLTKADAEAVRAFQDEHLPICYPPTFYSLLLSSQGSIGLVARAPCTEGASSALVGSICVRLAHQCVASIHDEPTPPTIYLLSLVIAPSARRTGIATRLLREALRALLPAKDLTSERAEENGPRACTLTLHVSKTNLGARSVYERWGLVEGRERRGWYRGLSGEDGVAIEYSGLVHV